MKHTLALVLMVFGIVGCATTPTTYDSDNMNLCDFNDISIKKFIEIRRNTLNEELSAAGF